MIGNQEGLSFDGERDVDVMTDDDFDSIIDGERAAVDESVNVATVIGAAAGGLAMVLLLLLLVRRNNGDEEISHMKLDDEGGEDTFIREFETNDSKSRGSDSDDQSYNRRTEHIVGEADSIFSGWTGYTPKKEGEIRRDNLRAGMNAHERGDVHKCSSATCEVCERRRQQGIKFIATGSPVRPQIPSDASREYMADDTVEL